MFEIRDHDNHVRIQNIELDIGKPTFMMHCAIDVQTVYYHMRVQVAMNTWIMVKDYVNFVNELKLLEDTRKGSATIMGLDPNKFELEILIYSSAGGCLVKGSTTKNAFVGNTQYDISCNFAFQFDPYTLPQLVIDSESLLIGNSDPKTRS